jgi:DNA-binding MarR family transcriptional regulator
MQMKLIYRAMQHYDIHPTQFEVLRILEKAGKSNQTDIARLARVSNASIGTSIRRLEKIGLVERSADANDLRATYVELSEKGREYAASARSYAEKFGKVKYKGFTPEELAQYRFFLERMRDNYQQYYEEAEGKKD